MNNNVERFFICFFAICISSLVSYMFISFACFVIRLLVFLLLNFQCLYILIQVICQICDLQVFFPILLEVLLQSKYFKFL